jgi:cation diffusion facilitator CzcD-associated flavoprotein CzcO
MEHVRIAIIGSGFAGIGMANRLIADGERDFVVLERAADLGGTWRDNTYPGCACDVPSHLYSFSYAPNPDWSSTFSPQPEIQTYLQRVARDSGAIDHVRLHHDVEEATWDEASQRWVLVTAGGTLSCDILIPAMGPLSEPKLPDVPGIGDFRGSSFHSAAWDHDHDLTGERVAVIGTGASAIQFVPRIQPQVGELQLYQRTPAWIVPRRDRPLTDAEHRLYRRLPAAQLAMRAGLYWAREGFVLALMGHDRIRKVQEHVARGHLAKQVPDPELRAKLTPNYAMGCKRILLSNDFYPSLMQPNVDVITHGIREVRAHSIVAADGTEREVDTIIYGTGFHVTDMPVADRVRGRHGRLLAEHWQGSPQAYKGTAIAGFPNLFMMVGPNTGLGHNSIVFMIESQVNYLSDILGKMRRRGLAVAEVREDVQAAFNEDVQRRLEGSVWNDGGCKSWYLDAQGRNTTLWPGFTWPFRQATRAADLSDYEVRPRLPAPARPAPVAA